MSVAAQSPPFLALYSRRALTFFSPLARPPFNELSGVRPRCKGIPIPLTRRARHKLRNTTFSARSRLFDITVLALDLPR